MKAISDFEPHLQIILKQMCDAVGADSAKIDFGATRWYMEHEWDAGQEAVFTKWLADYLFANREARGEMLEHNWKNKKHCTKAAEHFVWNHGWKTKT